MRSRQRDRSWTRQAGLILGVVCLLALFAYVWLFSIGEITHGFMAYYAAAHALGGDGIGPWVYDDELFRAYVQGLTRSPILEIYGPNPPTMTLLALPVVWLDHITARSVWLLLSVLSLAGGVTILARDALRREAAGVLAMIAVALLSPSVFANLRTGQAYLFVFGWFALAGHLLMRERDRRAGVALGLALALKSSGAPWLVLLAVRRPGTVITAIAVIGALIVGSLPWIDPATWVAYPSYLREFISRPTTGSTAYQTTEGFVRHLCVADARWNPAPAADCAWLAWWLPSGMTFGALVITFALTRRARLAHVIAAAVCLSLLVVPIAEDHHFVLLSVALFLLLPVQLRLARDWPLIGGAALLMVPAAWTISRFTDGWWALLAYPRLYAAWLVWVRCLFAGHVDKQSGYYADRDQSNHASH